MSRNESTLKPDGSGWRARIGVLTHDDSVISESELWTMAPAGVSLHTSRVFFDLATFADPPGPDNATALLARLPLQAIIYAWQAGSYLLGTTGEKELVSRVEQHSNGIPVLMSAPAATAGFRTLEAERIALIHAPFFTDDFDQKGAAYFQERGFEVVHVSHLMPPVEVPPPEHRISGESGRDLRVGSQPRSTFRAGRFHRRERPPRHQRNNSIGGRSAPTSTHCKPSFPVVCATHGRCGSQRR
jgi:hypothetical protein